MKAISHPHYRASAYVQVASSKEVERLGDSTCPIVYFLYLSPRRSGRDRARGLAIKWAAPLRRSPLCREARRVCRFGHVKELKTDYVSPESEGAGNLGGERRRCKRRRSE